MKKSLKLLSLLLYILNLLCSRVIGQEITRSTKIDQSPDLSIVNRTGVHPTDIDSEASDFSRYNPGAIGLVVFIGRSFISDNKLPNVEETARRMYITLGNKIFTGDAEAPIKLFYSVIDMNSSAVGFDVFIDGRKKTDGCSRPSGMYYQDALKAKALDFAREANSHKP